jgi:uncharacterized protein YbjT (DUF2867 family)
MNVILFGATGMIGQGVLAECLRDPGIERVVAVGRRSTGVRNGKLREVVHPDLLDYTPIASELAGHDACLYCLGVSSAGMREAAYRRITYDGTLAAARVLLERSPGLTFLYVSGAGTDSSERGRVMWARVKGATENALLRLPFRATYMIRPAYIQPGRGIRSRTAWTRVMYAVAGPLQPLWRRLFPGYVTTTEELARAMVRVARYGASRPVVESADIPGLAAAGAGPANPGGAA